MGCERRFGRRCGVNYFKNKLLFVSGLFFHFLYCLGSCFPGILPAWRYSLGPLMKYSPWLWADMRKVTLKVKRTNHGRRLGDGKFSYQTELFKGWARLNLETVAWRLPVEISQDLQNTVWWDELSSSRGQQSFSAHKTKYFMFDKNCSRLSPWQRSSCQHRSLWYPAKPKREGRSSACVCSPCPVYDTQFLKRKMWWCHDRRAQWGELGCKDPIQTYVEENCGSHWTTAKRWDAILNILL